VTLTGPSAIPVSVTLSEGVVKPDHIPDNAQALCAYETVGLGFSHWCGLFTYEEWEGYEYALDIGFTAGTAFASPVGRAIGVGTSRT
jgi:hypothetical protein